MKIPAEDSQLKCHLQDYRLKSILFLEEKDGSIRFEKGEEDLLKIDTNFVLHSEDKQKYMVRLNVDYAKRTTSENVFRMQCQMYGFFKSQLALNDQMDAKERYLLWLNGTTILYGLLRPIVASMSSQCFAGRVLLRTVMMNDVVNEAIGKMTASSRPQQAQEQLPLAPEPPNSASIEK